MRKTIIVCDKCKREIHDQYIQRPKDLHSNKVSDIQDICLNCAYWKMGNKIYSGKSNDKYKPLY